LLHVAEPDPTVAVFYAHTKGGPKPGGPRLDAITLWRNVMYRELLDNWQACLDKLRTCVFVGTHKQCWQHDADTIYPSGISNKHKWMFSGTFWWFRADVVFTEQWQQLIQLDRYGTEAWPGQLVHAENAQSMYQPWPDTINSFNPYNLREYPEQDHMLALE